MRQRTIRNSVSVTGVTLHSGQRTKLTLHPAKENTGVRFYRNGTIIPALCQYVTSTKLSTTLENNGQKVQTIEHLMSAISAYMIDNLIIEVDTSEIPILDGSALPFVILLEEAGILEQSQYKKFIKITKKSSVFINDKRVSIQPCSETRYTVKTKFDHPLIDSHTDIDYVYQGPKNFKRTVSLARTFGFAHELELMKQNDLALGGSLDNAILLNKYGMENTEPLRYNDEFVRHKLIDSIGDMRLLGHNFIGHYFGYKPGHHMNVELCRAVMRDKSYQVIQFDDEVVDLIYGVIQ